MAMTRASYGDEYMWCETCRKLVNPHYRGEGNGNFGSCCRNCGTVTYTLDSEIQRGNMLLIEFLSKHGYAIKRPVRCANHDCGMQLGYFTPEEYPDKCKYCGHEYWHFSDIPSKNIVVYKFCTPNLVNCKKKIKKEKLENETV